MNYDNCIEVNKELKLLLDKFNSEIPLNYIEFLMQYYKNKNAPCCKKCKIKNDCEQERINIFNTPWQLGNSMHLGSKIVVNIFDNKENKITPLPMDYMTAEFIVKAVNDAKS